MQLFWDFLRNGVPVTTAIVGGMWASGKGWKVIPTAGAVAASWGVGWLGQYLLGKVVEPSLEGLPIASIQLGAGVSDKPVSSADQVMKTVADRGDVKGLSTTARGEDGQLKQEGVVIDMKTQRVVDNPPPPPPTPMGTSGFNPGGAFGSQGTE